MDYERYPRVSTHSASSARNVQYICSLSIIPPSLYTAIIYTHSITYTFLYISVLRVCTLHMQSTPTFVLVVGALYLISLYILHMPLVRLKMSRRKSGIFGVPDLFEGDGTYARR